MKGNNGTNAVFFFFFSKVYIGRKEATSVLG